MRLWLLFFLVLELADELASAHRCAGRRGHGKQLSSSHSKEHRHKGHRLHHRHHKKGWKLQDGIRKGKGKKCSKPEQKPPIKPPQLVCDKPNTEKVDGECVCLKDFIDITQTDVPDRRNYKKGEKCISKDPCHDVRDLTVNFIVDSSISIGAQNWEHLVEFLRSGADYLPTTTRVGFLKYSTDVSFADFLEPTWTKKSFRDFVPCKYDNGETNTVAALDKATDMLQKDKNKNRVGVLITDGMPFTMEYEERQDEIMALTDKAAKKLRSSGVYLVALGYGPDLGNGSAIRKLLEDPREDYFEYDRKACDLKAANHMPILMRKICRRFVKH